jgi:hypothetical protein
MDAVPTVSNSPFQPAWPKHLDPENFSNCEKIGKTFFDCISFLLSPLHSLATYMVHPAAKIDLNKEIEIQVAEEEVNRMKTRFQNPEKYVESLKEILEKNPADRETLEKLQLIEDALVIIKKICTSELNAENYVVIDVTPKEYFSKQRYELSINFHGQRFHFSTPDGRVLDGMFFPGDDYDKVILARFGNGVPYEFAEEKIRFLLKSGASVFTYNPGGVGESEGYSHPDALAIDCYCAFQFLVNNGIDPNNILLWGSSLGGAETVRGGSVIQKHYEKEAEENQKLLTVFVNSINDRSLESIQAYGRWLGEMFDENMYPYGKIAEGLWKFITECDCLAAMLTALVLVIIKPISNTLGFSCVIPFFMPLVDWEMNCKSDFDQLKGQKCVIYHPLDRVIPESVQMFHAFTEEEKKGVIFINLGEDLSMAEEAPEGQPTTPDHHNRAFSEEEEERILAVVRQFLKIEESNSAIDTERVEVI